MSPFRNSVFRGPHLFAIAAMILLALATAASADDSLAMIKRTGTTTVGTEAAFPPFEMVKDGKIVGYGKDILLTTEKTNLVWLSDRFLLPSWSSYQVAFSLGDLLVASGAFWLLSTQEKPLTRTK